MAEIEVIDKPDGSCEVIVHGDLADRLIEEAERLGVSPQQVFEAALDSYLKERGY